MSENARDRRSLKAFKSAKVIDQALHNRLPDARADLCDIPVGHHISYCFAIELGTLRFPFHRFNGKNHQTAGAILRVAPGADSPSKPPVHSPCAPFLLISLRSLPC